MAQFAIDEVLTTGIQISGFIFDYSSSLGTPGQVLASTSSGVMWQADSSIPDLSSLSGLIAATGTLLNNRINSLSGYSDATFATITNLAATGSTLNNKINSLSGYVNNTFLSGSGTQYYVPRWNTSKELVTGSIYDLGTGIGIGTTNPVTLLTVGSTTTTTSAMTLQGEYQSSTFNNTNIFNFRHGGFDRWRLLTAQNSAASNDFDFSVNAINAATNGYNTFLTIKGLNGNVGIGTVSPSTLLSVGGAGSASAASGITFGGDASANLYRSAAGALTIDGSLGIGTSPSHKLHVYGANIRQMTQSSTDASYLLIGQWDGSTNRIESSVRKLFLTSYTSGIAFGINGSENMTLDTNGNLGIGTTSPSYRLQLGSLAGSQTSTPETINLGGTYSDTAGSNIKLRVFDDGSSSGGMNVSLNQVEVNTWSTGKIAFYRGTTQSAIIDANGNVGIGITSPIGKLTVQGNVEVNYNSTTADTYVRRSFLTAHALVNRGANISFGLLDGASGPAGMTVNNIAAAVGAYNSQFITFLTHEGGVSEGERMRITQLGYVGIGTFTPLTLLSVGTAGSTSAANGLTFGGDASANLYRISSSRIKTDGSLEVAIGIISPTITSLSGNIAATGSVLDTKINTLSGYSNANFATITNLAATGSTLNARINSLSGYAGSTFLSGQGVANWTARWNGTKELITGSIYDLGTGIGIGTTSPVSLLTVGAAGSTSAVNGISFGGDVSASLFRDSNASIATDGAFYAAGRIRSADYIQFNSNLYSNAFTNPIDINVGNSAGNAWLSAIRFNQGGYVGIGTNQPSGKLHIVSSVAGETVLRADGTNGTLFSVTDDLSDSLMSVNNSAGLPVFEVFADDRVVAGQYGSGDFVLVNNKVGIGTTNPTYKLHVLGDTLISGNLTNPTIIGLSGALNITGSTLDTKINTLSGYSNANFATILNLATTGSTLDTKINTTNTNLAATGSTLDTKINTLSGYSNANFATITNLATTGSTLDTKINTLSGYSNNSFATIVNLAATGSTLDTKINTLSGYSNANFATITNLATTGSTLNARINSLSGYAGSTFLSGQGVANWTARWNGTKELITGSIYDIGTAVGIGTTNPLAKLQISRNGDNGSNGLIDYGMVTVSSGHATQATLGAEVIGDGYSNLNLGSNIAGIRTFWHISKRLSSSTPAHSLQYFYYDGSTFNHRFTFAAGGSLGIGTADPSSLLDVIGTVRFNSLGAAETRNVVNQAGQRISMPSGGAKFLGNSATGAIRIKSPVNGSSDSMHTIKGTVFEYTTGKSFQFLVSFYYYSTTAQQVTAQIIGGSNAALNRNFTVRIGRDANSAFLIYIGELADSWNYAYVYITELFFGWSMDQSNLNNYQTGWTISTEGSAFENVMATVADTQITNWSRNGSSTYYTLGNVGIGTASPTTLLSVGGAGSTLPASGITFGGDAQVNLYRITEDVLRTDANLDVLGYVSAGGHIYTSAYIQVAQGNIYPGGYTSDLNLNIGNTAANNWETAIKIKPGSYVGIGTTNPTGKLHIVSSVAGETVLRADGTNGTLFSVVDDLSDSLMSVNNSAGLPVLEVFADDRIVAGQYGSGDFVIVNNKVGIGTSNPSYRLDVRGSGVNSRVGLMEFGTWPLDTTYIYLQNNSLSLIGANYGFLQSPAGETFVNAAAGQTLHFRIGNVEKWAVTSAGILQSDGAQTIRTSTGPLTLATNAADGHIILSPNGAGNVGIGTTNPTATYGKLSVAGGIRTLDDNNSKLELGRYSAGASNSYIKLGSNSNSLRITNNTDAADIFTILNGVNVGIGTTNPVSKLNISDGASMYAAGSGEMLQIKRNTTNGSDSAQTRILLGNNSNTFAISYGGTTDRLRFIDGGDVEVLTLRNGGNVGIGTTNPAYKLDVFSSIVSRSNISTPRFSSAGGYVYGLTNSPSWNQSCGAYTNNNATAPDGTTSAGTYTLTSTCGSYDIYQTISSLTVGRVYTIGMWVKLGTATNFCLVANNTYTWNSIGGKAFTSSDGLSTSKWTHISYTFTAIAPGNINLHLGYHAETAVTQQTAGTVFLWNIEMTEFSSTWIGNVEDEIRLPGSSIWTSRGNVGIGTTNTDPLSLSRERNLAIVTTGTNAALTIVGGAAGRIDFGVGATRTAGIYSDSSNYTEIFTSTALPLVFSTNSAEKMRIKSDGNVGIGTTNPVGKLTVQGNIEVNYNSTTADSFVRRSFLTAHATINRGANIAFGLFDGGSNPMGMTVYNTAAAAGAYNSQFIVFHTHEGGVNEGERMRITSLGNVGIGTFTPLSLLTVGEAGSTSAAKGLSFGGDASANLYRSAASTIKTDGSLIVAVNTTTASLDVAGIATAQYEEGQNQYSFRGANRAINDWDYSGLTINPTYDSFLDGSWYIDAGISNSWDRGLLSKRRFRRVEGLTLEYETYTQTNDAGNVYVMIGFVGGNSVNFSYAQTPANLIYQDNNTLSVFTNGGSSGSDYSFDTRNAWWRFKTVLKGTGALHYVYRDNKWNLIKETSTNNQNDYEYLRVVFTLYRQRVYIRDVKVYVAQESFRGSNYLDNVIGNLFVNGSVGIGTTNPTQKLDIVGSYGAPDDNAGILKIKGPGVGPTQLNFGVSADGGYGWIQATDIAVDNDRDIILGPLGGNVGIGITNPAYKLDVSGGSVRVLNNPTTNNWGLRLENANVNGWGVSQYFRLYGYNSTPAASFDVLQIVASYPGFGQADFLVKSQAQSTAATVMSLLGNGRVGIGTASPTTLLSVGGAGSTLPASGITFGGNSVANLYRSEADHIKTDGSFVVTNTLIVGGGQNGIRILKNGSDSISSNLYIANAANTRAYNFQPNAAGTNLALWTYNSANAWQNSVNFNYNGSVGIGTTTPSGKLHIVSTIAGETVLRTDGTNGTLFSVVDDLSDSLMSVNNSAGLPVLEVFADDRVVAGQYGSGDFVLINNKVGLGTSNPTNKLSVIGGASIGSSTYNVAAPSNGLIVEGNVGIGLTNPAFKLDVSGIIAVSNSPFVDKVNNYNRIYEPAGNGAIYLGNASDPANYYDNSSHSFRSRAGSSLFVVIDGNGSVGIGTNSVAGKFDVYASGNAGHLAFIRNLSAGSSAYSALVLRRDGDTNGLVMFTNSSTRTTDGGAGNSTIRTDNGKLLVGAGATTYHSFETNGNVGIGLTNPAAARLHIKGNDSDPVLRVESASLVAGTSTASKTFVGWMPIMTGAAVGDKVFIPLFK